MSRVQIAEGDEAAPAGGAGRKAGVLTLLAVFLLIGLFAWRMVPHPIGPARTFGKYEGKAVTTAKAAESEVQATATDNCGGSRTVLCPPATDGGTP